MSPSLEQGPLREAAILTRAVENVFRKLIRLLVGRMSLTKLQEMIRIIFVEEAERKLQRERPGKKVPMTNMAVLTGLDTRTLNKLSEERIESGTLESGSRFLKEITPTGSILDYWSTNPQYLNDDGEPLILEIKGEGKSFESLVKKAISTRGVTANSLLERLIDSRSVELDKSAQTVRLINSGFFPFVNKDAIGAIEFGLASVGNLVGTIAHNVESKADPSGLLFQRSYWTNRLNEKDKYKLRQSARQYLNSAGNDSSNMLARLEEEETSDEQITAGIGLFYFEEKPIS